MSSERIELAQMLLAAIKEAPHIWIDSQLGLKEVTIDGAVDLTAVAAALTAAGYRKPRIITTAEELDALPSGSVILDADGDAMQFDGNFWQMTGYGDDFGSHEMRLPATILWEPTP